jgi:DNA-binding NtrC family response regulator
LYLKDIGLVMRVQYPPPEVYVMGPEEGAAITVLAVGLSHGDLGSLKAIFSHSRWRLYQATSYAEAISFLDLYFIPVVISEENLPDRTWRDLLAHGPSLPNPPKLIVASHFADNRLWAEALNLGAYDVLAMPFRAAEVFHSVSLAWRRWKDWADHKDRSLCTECTTSAAAK